jgi:PilZ domain
MAQDKRKTVRKRTPQIVYVELGSDNGGILLNLSEGGCSFQAISPVQQGKLHFKFEIGEGRKIEGDAELAWSDDSKKLGGLRFVDLSNEVRSQIGTWLGQATPADRRPASAAIKPQAPAMPSVDPSLKLKVVPPRRDTDSRAPNLDRSPRNIDVRSPEAKTGRGDTLADLVAEVFSEESVSAPSPEPAPNPQSGRTRGLQGDASAGSTLVPANARPKLSDNLAEFAAEVFAETAPAQSAPSAELPMPTPSDVPSAAESEAKRRRARLRAEARLAASSRVDPLPGPPTETIPSPPETAAQASPAPSPTTPTHAPRVPQAWQNLAADPSPYAGRDYPVPTQSGAQVPKPPVRTDPAPSAVEPAVAHLLSDQVDAPIPSRSGHSAVPIHHAPFENLDDLSSHTPVRRSAGLGTGVAAIVIAAGLAAAIIFFHQQIGSSLIWLGGSLRGDSAATVVSPPSNARPAIAPASPGAAPASNDATPGEEIAQQPLSSNGPAASPTENEALSLWTATKNGDLHAQVLLGERMALGNGVKKNCDLARVLLTSAMRKGNAEAKVKLDELPKLGCPAD